MQAGGGAAALIPLGRLVWPDNQVPLDLPVFTGTGQLGGVLADTLFGRVSLGD